MTDRALALVWERYLTDGDATALEDGIEVALVDPAGLVEAIPYAQTTPGARVLAYLAARPDGATVAELEYDLDLGLDDVLGTAGVLPLRGGSVLRQLIDQGRIEYRGRVLRLSARELAAVPQRKERR